MKKLIYILMLAMFMAACHSTQRTISNEESRPISEQDTVRIANEDIEYEIIIIEPGFNSWLYSRAKPEGYYSQEFMEGRNIQYVMEWNRRVTLPTQYGNLYEMQIDYDRFTDYGYDVNYKLYNYFIYFQIRYNQRLAGFVPRI